MCAKTHYDQRGTNCRYMRRRQCPYSQHAVQTQYNSLSQHVWSFSCSMWNQWSQTSTVYAETWYPDVWRPFNWVVKKAEITSLCSTRGSDERTTEICTSRTSDFPSQHNPWVSKTSVSAFKHSLHTRLTVQSWKVKTQEQITISPVLFFGVLFCSDINIVPLWCSSINDLAMDNYDY